MDTPQLLYTGLSGKGLNLEVEYCLPVQTQEIWGVLLFHNLNLLFCQQSRNIVKTIIFTKNNSLVEFFELYVKPMKYIVFSYYYIMALRAIQQYCIITSYWSLGWNIQPNLILSVNCFNLLSAFCAEVRMSPFISTNITQETKGFLLYAMHV